MQQKPSNAEEFLIDDDLEPAQREPSVVGASSSWTIKKRKRRKLLQSTKAVAYSEMCVRAVGSLHETQTFSVLSLNEFRLRFKPAAVRRHLLFGISPFSRRKKG